MQIGTPANIIQKHETATIEFYVFADEINFYPSRIIFLSCGLQIDRKIAKSLCALVYEVIQNEIS